MPPLLLRWGLRGGNFTISNRQRANVSGVGAACCVCLAEPWGAKAAGEGRRKRVRRAVLAAPCPSPYPHTLSAATLSPQPPPIQVFLMSLNISDKGFFFLWQGLEGQQQGPVCQQPAAHVLSAMSSAGGGTRQRQLRAQAPRHNPAPPWHKHTRVHTGPRGLQGCHRTGVTPVTSVPHPCLLHAAPRTSQHSRGGGLQTSHPLPTSSRCACPLAGSGGASPRGTVPAPPPPCCCCVSAPRPGEARRGRRGRAGQRRGRI